MAHSDDIGVAIDHLDGIEERFSFDNRGRLYITKIDNIAAQSFIAVSKDIRVRARFEEEITENLPLKQRKIQFASSNRKKSLSISKNAVYVVIG